MIFPGKMIQFDEHILQMGGSTTTWRVSRSFWDAELRQVLRARAAAGTCHAREPQMLETLQGLVGWLFVIGW